MLEKREASRPQRRRTQKERSSAMQERLLDATIDCIVELGYASTSTTEVCKRAGVSRGAQVHHYPTKAILVAAAIERLFSRRHREFRESLGPDPDLDTAFSDLWRLYTGPTLQAWMELLIAARTDAQLREHLRAVDERFFDEAKQTCRRLLGRREIDDAGLAAVSRMVLATLDGLALNRMLGHPDETRLAALALLKLVMQALPQPVKAER